MRDGGNLQGVGDRSMWALLAELSLQNGLVRAGLLFAAIAVLTGLGALVVSRFRGLAEDDQPSASQILSNFRELHEQGKLNDQEFRNIKTLLKDKLQQELSNNEEQD